MPGPKPACCATETQVSKADQVCVQGATIHTSEGLSMIVTPRAEAQSASAEPAQAVAA